MAKSKMFHAVAVFSATGAMERDRFWSDVFGVRPGTDTGGTQRVIKDKPGNPLKIPDAKQLFSIEQSFSRAANPDRQIKVDQVTESNVESAPFFVDLHTHSRVPMQLVVFEQEFRTANEASKWLDTDAGKMFSQHSDYVTVLFMGS